jgi:predicted DsbA family dithiol-disulfide isomerase
MFAKKHGVMKEMTEQILRAYFTQGKHIGDHATLVQLAEEIGLDGLSDIMFMHGSRRKDNVSLS